MIGGGSMTRGGCGGTTMIGGGGATTIGCGGGKVIGSGVAYLYTHPPIHTSSANKTFIVLILPFQSY